MDNVEVAESLLTQERIDAVTAMLNEEYAGQNVIFTSGKTDAVLAGNVTAEGIKGAFIGYCKDADTSSWENISCLTNTGGIVWKNKVGNLTGNEGKNSIVRHAPEPGALGGWTDGTDNRVSLGGGYDASRVMSGTGAEDFLVRQYSTGKLGYYADGDMSRWVELGRGVNMNWTVIA